MRLILTCVVWLLWQCSVVEGLKLKGTITTDKDWSFLERFCFKYNSGKLQYTIEYPVRYQTIYMLYYYDRLGVWEEVYSSKTMTCQDKVSVLDAQANQLSPLSLGACESYQKGGETWFTCNHLQKFTSSRDMWWFFAVSRCPNTRQDKNLKGINLTYDFHLTNGEEGDILHREFSADEFYILLFDIIFFILYGFLISISVIIACKLYTTQLLHSTYKLFMASLAVWWLHLLLYVIAYGSYSQSGYRLDDVKRAGHLLSLIAIGLFILMLLLLANGYTIVMGKLKKAMKIALVIIMVLYYLLTTILIMAEGKAFDRALVLYIYEFWPGYCLIAIRLICYVIFIVMLIFTLKKHRKKRRFYIPFTLLYTLWFLAGPLVILLAVFVMDDWAREKTVHGIEQTIMFGGHVFFLILTRPNQAKSNFPYTIKTSRISIMRDTDEDGRANAYEITDTDERKIDIFQTSTQSSSSSSSQGSNTSNM